MKTIPWLDDYHGPTISTKYSYELVLGKMEQPRPTDGDVEVEYLNSGCLSWQGVEADPNRTMWASRTDIRNLSIKSGDLLISEGGDVGRAAIYCGEPGRIFQKSLHRARSHKCSDVRYLKYVLMALHGSGWLDILCNKATMAHFTAEKLGSLDIPEISAYEQRRIADFLDAETTRIDKLVALQSAARGSVLARTGAQLDLKIDEVASVYGSLPFRRTIWSIEQGSSPQCDNFPAYAEKWGVLKISAVKNGVFYEDENKQLPADIEPERRYEIKNGDLLITRANTPQLVGAAAVADSPRPKLLLCDKIFRVTTTADLLPDFLVFVSLSTQIRDMCAEASHGTSQSMANLKTEEIKRWPIPAAPVQVQRNVIAELSEARDHTASLIDAIDRQLVLLAERRQALITAAVTGEITV